MTFTLSRRGLVRLCCFLAAIAAIPSVFAWKSSKDAENARQALTYQAMQSMSSLALHMQNIDGTLEKALYAKTPSMLSSLSDKLAREAGYAKLSLDSLPLKEVNLQNANKLLSQVGDYCQSLARAYSQGEAVTPEQRENMLALQKYCDVLLDEILLANDGLQTGSIRIGGGESNLSREFDRAAAAPTVAEGFAEFEEGCTSYPTLIYDGPFSDHIMERTPAFLEGRTTVSRAEARQTAAFAANVRQTQLADGNDEDGKMPSYAFSAPGLDVSVTKQGGYLCYLMKNRTVGKAALSPEEALEAAGTYLRSLGIREMTPTYYEIAGGELTVSMAAAANSQDKRVQVVLYPDLVKVRVALDNGEITGFDARGYLVNHRARPNLAPVLSEQECLASVSELLTVENSRLCLIPGEGLTETLCREFSCLSPEGEQVLVYVNAVTGEEEQILLLVISENGQLTI